MNNNLDSQTFLAFGNVAIVVEVMCKQLLEANAKICHQQAHLEQATENLNRVKQDKGRANPKEHRPKVNSPPTFFGKGSVTSWCTQVDNYLRDASDKEALTIAMTYFSGAAHEWWIVDSSTPQG